MKKWKKNSNKDVADQSFMESVKSNPILLMAMNTKPIKASGSGFPGNPLRGEGCGGLPIEKLQ